MELVRVVLKGSFYEFNPPPPPPPPPPAPTSSTSGRILDDMIKSGFVLFNKM
jgi:hypothetical protein